MGVYVYPRLYYSKVSGPISVLHSHWSRNVEACLSLVESFMMLLRQLSYALCSGIQSPLLGGLCLLLAGSLWHKRAGVATHWTCRPMRAKPRHSSSNESGPGWLLTLRAAGCHIVSTLSLRDTLTAPEAVNGRGEALLGVLPHGLLLETPPGPG